MDKISIITVCFNAENSICQTIDSVLNQTYPSVEYIIIDGKSVDKTNEYIKLYKKKILDRGYEFTYLSEKDSGIYDAMNKGVLLSTGKWIHFRNAGDYFFDNNVLGNIFITEINPLTEIIHSDIRVWDNYGYCDKKPLILEKSYKEAMPVWHPAAFIKSELHKKNLFDIFYRLSADYAFFYKCFESNVNFQYFPITVALVNVEEGASINNFSFGLRENSRIRGFRKFSYSFIKLYFLITVLSIRNYLKEKLSSKYNDKIKIKSRKNAGWVINDKFRK